MDKAVGHGVVKAGAPKVVVYLVPAIIVPRDNPRHIASLEDLARPGVRVGIGRPDSVCVGLYGVQILAEQGLLKAVRPNIVTQAESCAKTCSVASLGLVDAVLGWRAFQFWDPARLKAVMLKPAQVGRIATMTAAPTKYAKDKALAEKFVDFLRGPEARAIFRKWGYLPTLKEARRFTLPDTLVGGTAPLPRGWEGDS
jgi:molybdate transport system substrate-binding protein